MVEWGRFPYAHELLRADLDHGNAGRIVKMRDDPVSHCSGPISSPQRNMGRADFIYKTAAKPLPD